MRIPGFGKGNQPLTPQKKLVSLRFFEFLNKLVKAESDYKDSTESSLIENKVLDTYLNSDDRLAEIVANNLLKDNGIMICASKIMEIYKLNPALANDSLIDFLQFLQRLIQRHELHLKTTDDGIVELSKYATEYMTYINDCVEKNAGYSFYDLDGKTTRHVHPTDLCMLEDVANADKSQHTLDCENIFYVCLYNVLTFWNFGGDAHTPSLKNWNVTYAMLKAVFDVYELPDYGPYTYEFSQTVKEIRMEEKNIGAYDNTITLSKEVFLYQKSFVTTADAVILKSKDGEPDRYFKNAYRIIHGQRGPATQKPFIILCANESSDELSKIVEEKVAAYPDEFPDPNDSYHTQFMYDGAYFDQRIRWKTI